MGLAAIVGLSCGAGCVGAPEVLPPRAAPPRQVPAVAQPASPPTEGLARVVLHTTDGPMRVTARADSRFHPPGTDVPATQTGELCTTPCVVDLPPGRYRLYLVSADGSYSQADVDDLEVRSGTNYYVRAPGKSENPHWMSPGPLAMSIGGGLLLTAGAATAGTAEQDGTETAGFLMLGAGAAVMIAGAILNYDAGRGSLQQGATTSWSEPSK